MTKAEIENCEQTERQKHDEKVRELCSNCNKPMWRYKVDDWPTPPKEEPTAYDAC